MENRVEKIYLYGKREKVWLSLGQDLVLDR